MKLASSWSGHRERFVWRLAGWLLFAITLQGNSQEIEEVIVTATKREGTIQSMSAVVSAMTSEQMAMRGIATTQDLAFSVPGLVYGESVGSPQITIRGIGLSVETGAAEMGVASYVNGVFLSRPGLTNLAMGDLERIEVLRGPQGTLYGRNATGGAVNFISKRPTLEPEFSASVGRSSFDKEKIELALSSSITESSLGARLYAKYEHTDGYLKNLSELGGFEDPGQADDSSVRLSLLSQLLDNLELDMTLGYVKKKGNINMFQVISFAGEPVSSADGSQPFTVTPNETYHNVRDRKTIDGKLGALALTWDMESVSLKSVTGYTLHTRDEYYDGDGRDPVVGIVPADLGLLPGDLAPGELFIDTDIAVDREDDYKTVTQEFNLTGTFWQRLDYIFGVFYMRETGNFKIHSEFGPSTPLAGTPLVGSNLEEKNHSKAVFADVAYSLRHDLRLLAGARYGRDTKAASQTDFSISREENGYNSDGSCSNNPELEYTNFSPKAGIEYDFSESILLYATYQEATKPGGYNVTVCGDEFFEEEVSAYEAGFKSSFFSGQLVVNATAFTYDYTNYQIFQLRPPATAEVLNAPKAHIDGAELEMRGSWGAYFDINIGYSYLEARYDEFSGIDGIYKIGGPGEQDLSGNRLTRAPDWSANIGVELTFPLDWMGLSYIKLRAEASHMDDLYFRQFNTDFDRQEAYTVSNVFLAVASKHDTVRLRAYINNVGDTEYVVSQISNALELFAVTPDEQGRQATFLGFYGPPRTTGLELSLTF